MNCKLSGKRIFDNDIHPTNAKTLIYVTVLGISIFDNALQLAKKPEPIS